MSINDKNKDRLKDGKPLVEHIANQLKLGKTEEEIVSNLVAIGAKEEKIAPFVRQAIFLM